MVAGSAMLVILPTALFLRKGQYETFHIVHITMAALILITAAMHRPDIPMVGKIVIIAASLWIADRTLRLLKLALYGYGNTATITPLPYGGTRIVMRKTPIGAAPGTHCFLWIPGVRATESHPFTVLSTTPFEMVVAAYDGFTRDLHTRAMENPGQVFKASVDGPYGTVPNFTLYSKVLFIAGGSGASFTCGTAVDLLRKLGDSSLTSIEFVWVVKEQGKSPDLYADLTLTLDRTNRMVCQGTRRAHCVTSCECPNLQYVFLAFYSSSSRGDAFGFPDQVH
jgi:predicted ferric reductase